MIKTVLLDLDDTILDFKMSERVALTKTLNELSIEPTEEIIKKYSSNFIKEGMEYIAKGASAALIYKIVPENVSGKLRR